MKLDYKKTIKVGTAFAIIMVFWTSYDYVVPLLLENAFGLSNSMRGLIMGLDNLLSLFMLPLFGRISDKLVSKYGKRTPFIVAGTLVSAALMIFVPVSAGRQLNDAMNLRYEITATFAADGSYLAGYAYQSRDGVLALNGNGVTEYKGADGKVYTGADAVYSMLYEKGKGTDGVSGNADYCDYQFLKANGIDFEKYMEIAQNGAAGAKTADDGKTKFTFSDDYIKYVKTGINNYASDEVYETITKQNVGTLVVYMVILFFVLVAMAVFRSPAVALMPDVTPKPLRSQANAMISLVGGAGGAVAFLIYTIVLSVNPTAYTLVFGLVALSMLLLLAAYLRFVKENKLVAECEALCAEYGINDGGENDEAENAALGNPENKKENVGFKNSESKAASAELKNSENKKENTALNNAENKTDAPSKRLKKAKFISFLLILASIFMWFLGYNAVQSNLSIFLTKTLGLGAGIGGLVSGLSMGISAVAFIPVGMLAVKIGRRKSIICGFILAVVSFMMIYFFAANAGGAVAVLFTVFYLLAGFGLIIANVNTFPMVVELSTKDKVGRYTGFYYTATMSAQAVTPFIAGLVMDAAADKYLFLYAAACVVAAIVLMFFVKHGDSKAIPPKSKIEMIGGD
ncbi:MAG: MFS transporter [Clostridiales bacterium]|jgi:MFS family permease|nr:MFS transporter [Clostridiales bacterium]